MRFINPSFPAGEPVERLLPACSGFLGVGRREGVFSGPHLSLTSGSLQQHVLLESGKMTNRFDHTQQNKRVCKAIWSLVEFLWEGTACVCECVKEELGGPGWLLKWGVLGGPSWLLKWGVLKGVLFLHTSCLPFSTLCVIAFARIKQWSIFSPEVYCCSFVLQLQGENVDKHQNLGFDDGIQPHYYFFFFKMCAFYFFYCGK